MNNVALSPLQLLLSSSTRAPAAHNNDHQYHDRDKQRYQHRYTDTCLFYPSALATRRKRRDGYMRRYSTSSIESSQTTVMANNTSTKSIHRKALSLSAFHQLQLGTTEQASKATIVSSIHNDHKLESSAVHQDHKHMTMGDSMTMATKTTNDASDDASLVTLQINTTAHTTTTNTNITTTTTTTTESSLVGNNSNHKNDSNDLQNAMATRHSLSAAKTEPSSTEHHAAAAQEQQQEQSGESPPYHETIEMAQRVPSKAVRIERDYSRGDGVTRFCTEFPPELSGRIDANQLCHTIEKMNAMLENAEKISLNVFDNIMECLTLYIWPVFFSTHYLRSIKQLMQFIDAENERLYHPQGISIANPVRHAFLFIEIRLYD